VPRNTAGNVMPGYQEDLLISRGEYMSEVNKVIQELKRMINRECPPAEFKDCENNRQTTCDNCRLTYLDSIGVRIEVGGKVERLIDG
jgi:hypothetical protein